MLQQDRAPDSNLFPVAIAFVAGATVIGIALAAFVLLARNDPSESEQAPLLAGAAPCAGARYDQCMLPTASALAAAGPWSACIGEGKHVCLVTAGAVEGALVDRQVAHFREEYGLEVRRGPAAEIPEEVVNSGRHAPDSGERQMGARKLVDHLTTLRIDAGVPNNAIEGATIIILTPVDLYLESREQWRYAFGQTFRYTIRGEDRAAAGVISYYRMDDRVYRVRYSDDLFASRVTKMVSKYVGLYHYDLPLSPDFRSPTFNNILSLDDLDNISERLPLNR